MAMQWGTPKTWAVGDPLDVASLNAEVRDRMTFLFNALQTTGRSYATGIDLAMGGSGGGARIRFPLTNAVGKTAVQALGQTAGEIILFNADGVLTILNQAGPGGQKTGQLNNADDLFTNAPAGTIYYVDSVAGQINGAPATFRGVKRPVSYTHLTLPTILLV